MTLHFLIRTYLLLTMCYLDRFQMLLVIINSI
nr:MAG TPA: hypothetical protein [Crassvirales sp.]